MSFPLSAQPPGSGQKTSLADRLVQALEAVLDHAPETNEHKAEALAEAALHVFGINSYRQSWDADARTLAELVKAVGFTADGSVGGPCAIPPGTILGAKPAALRDARPLRIVTDDRPADAQVRRVFDETTGWGG